jgi:sugar lactone lactonase YvrE
VAIRVQDDPATPVTDKSGGLDGPIGLAFDNAGNLYVSSFNTGNILSYDSTGVFRNSLGPNGTLSQPAEIVFGPNSSDLYVSESDGNTMRRFIGAAGEPTVFVGADDPFTPDINENGGLLTPRGLGFSADGSLLVNSSGTNQVLRYDGTTGAFVEVFLSSDDIPSTSDRLDRPVGMLLLPVVSTPPGEQT